MIPRPRSLALAPALLLLPLGACASLARPATNPAASDRWLAEDKLEHFFASFAATSVSAGIARAAGLDAEESMWTGFGVGVALGIGKELRDLRAPDDSLSFRDLTWDLAGDAAAAALVRQVR